MKRIYHAFSRLLLVAALLGGGSTVWAQSSVRRVPRKTEAAQDDKAAQKKKTEAKKPAAQPAKPVSTRNNDANNNAVKPTPEMVAKKNPATPTRRVTTRSVAGSAASQVDPNSLRSQAFDEYQKEPMGDNAWQRVVYRELDVTQGSNASLYYPQEPMDGLTNFFRVVLDLIVNNKVKGYEYLDGREVFSEKYEIKVQDILDKFQIPYQQTPAKGKAPTAFVIDESDVPCNEVLSYYLKERWEFDYVRSVYGPRVLAICPVLHRSGDFGGDAVKYPMFWLNFEDLRPYLRKYQIVSEGMNNAPRFTMEDFFRMNQYEGDIYKVQNLRGLSLLQQYANPDTLKMVQAKVDAELKSFNAGIWVPEEAAKETVKKDVKSKSSKDEADASKDTNRSPAESKLNRRTGEVVDVEAAEAEKDRKQEAAEEKAKRTGAAHSVRRSR